MLISVLYLMGFHQSALAGPPLICHPFEIGNARSLPWNGPVWSQIDKQYNNNRLVEDTLALLTPETPVLVRMETLRRATVYALLPTLDRTVASPVKDVTLARELLARLKARVPDAGVKSEKTSTAMALFDYGYLIESYKQTGPGSQGVQLAGGVDGYGMIVKAIGMRGGDPEMEFAVALAKWDRNGSHLAHLQRSIAGAPEGSLLARNLVSHFSNLGKTLAELRAAIAKN
jgi:hypothetical protein